MKANVVCSDSIKRTLLGILERRGILYDPGAGISFVEKGMVTDGNVIVQFESENLNDLLLFLEQVQKLSANGKIDLLVGKDRKSYKILEPGSILYFYADGNTIYASTITGTYEVNKKLYELEVVLFGKGFIRINKSVIVNIYNVNEIFPWFGGRLLLRLKNSSEELEVSRNYVKDFKSFLGL